MLKKLLFSFGILFLFSKCYAQGEHKVKLGLGTSNGFNSNGENFFSSPAYDISYLYTNKLLGNLSYAIGTGLQRVSVSDEYKSKDIEGQHRVYIKSGLVYAIFPKLTIGSSLRASWFFSNHYGDQHEYLFWGGDVNAAYSLTERFSLGLSYYRDFSHSFSHSKQSETSYYKVNYYGQNFMLDIAYKF
ncbi:hypothetical protein [Persicobacter psychrovividus]|uniref:Outer membrane protein beta-barrel domain-containing protein n=1 Tax=Persicobacter psychrovividus TaxID=387638 RepID=A0ABM7VMX7_9BACT|nr:hypothetical protein PEPS_46520 [Persicobacter psychrovividus]